MRKKLQAKPKQNRKLQHPKHLEAQRPLDKPSVSDFHITKPVDSSSA